MPTYFSRSNYTGDGVTTQHAVSFPFLLREHVVLYLDEVASTAFTWMHDGLIDITVAPAVGVSISIRRETPVDSRVVDYVDGANLVEIDLDNAQLQTHYIVQELIDRYSILISGIDLDADTLDGLDSTAFALAVHNHIIADVTGLQAELDAKALLSHSHIIADTTGLQAALDAKAAAAHTHVKADITDFAHTHLEADITDLQAYLLDAPSDGSEYVRKDAAWVVASGGGGGSSIVLDLGDDAADESVALGEIATINDTNAIFTEPTADKLLIDASKNWPKADDVDIVGQPSTLASAQAGDYTIIYDTSHTANKRVLLSGFLKSVRQLTELAVAPDGAADYLLVYDESASEAKKMLIDNLPSSGGADAGAVEEIAVRDFGVTSGATMDVNIEGYDVVFISGDGLVKAVADRLAFRTSSDGVTFDAAAADYKRMWMEHASAAITDLTLMLAGSSATVTNAEAFEAQFTNCSTAAAKTMCSSTGWVDTGAGGVSLRTSYRDELSVAKAIRIMSEGGNTINAGVVRVSGIRSVASVSPQKTVLDLTGAGVTYNIPDGCTRVEFHSGPIVMSATGGPQVQIRNSGTANPGSGTAQTHGSAPTAASSYTRVGTAGALVTGTGNKFFLTSWVYNPRDAAIPTTTEIHGTSVSTLGGSSHMMRMDTTQDDNEIYFEARTNNFTSGKVYLTAYFD